MEAISWFEKIAEFRSDVRATEGRIAWATVEMLSERGPAHQAGPPLSNVHSGQDTETRQLAS